MFSINHWFFKRRGLALGVVTSGSSVGGVIWPIAIDHLIINVEHLPLELCVLLTYIFSGRLWVGSSHLRLHLPGSDRRRGYHGTGSFTPSNRIRFFRIRPLPLTGVLLLLVSPS